MLISATHRDNLLKFRSFCPCWYLAVQQDGGCENAFDSHIRSLKPEAKLRKYFDGGGLFLYVPINGSKLWRMSYRFDGKCKLLSFGDYPTVSLKDARAKREEAKGLLAKGIDPAEQKKNAREQGPLPSATVLRI